MASFPIRWLCNGASYWKRRHLLTNCNHYSKIFTYQPFPQKLLHKQSKEMIQFLWSKIPREPLHHPHWLFVIVERLEKYLQPSIYERSKQAINKESRYFLHFRQIASLACRSAFYDFHNFPQRGISSHFINTPDMSYKKPCKMVDRYIS